MGATYTEHFANQATLFDVPSGIPCCGEIHWGTHFCHLYETRDDLIDTLVPFFLAGFANNDKCLWITAEPLCATDATIALAQKLPDLQRYLDSKQIQISDYTEWYARIANMEADAVLQGWVDAEQQALAEGYSGLRVTGNINFLKSREEWHDFERYEACVGDTIAGHRIIGLCSYQLDTARGSDVLDVVRNHQFAVARRGGNWEMVENAAIKLAKEDLHIANLNLEKRVVERTTELSNALATVEAQKRELETELANAELVHSISSALINEGVVDDFYQKLVDAAALVMHSDFATIQRFDPERNALQIIADHNFNAEALAFWEWVPALRPTSCGIALHRQERFVVSDFEEWEYAAGSADLAAFRAGGVRAAQSTPLLSRSGTLVGMISTHWKHPHQPSERDLKLLDVIARQAADLIERNTVAKALKEQAEQLLEADRHKDVFLATLAHELRNPLAPIQTGLSLLRINGPENAPHVLTVMERQLAHMVRLVDELLDVSRVSRGLITLKRERVRLDTVIESAIETSRPLFETAGHELKVAYTDQQIWIDADTTRVAQILSNVLNNAAKYTPEGGRVQLSVEPSGAEVCIHVADNGIGISKDMLDKVFDLFSRADDAIERSQSGLGVGLSLAKQLAELHGGTIKASSDGVGRGATFTICLPVADAPEKALAPHQSQKHMGDNSIRRILIVDDNVDAAETLALLLDALGYTTLAVCEPLRSLHAALDFQPDVAFLDIGMPELNGFDLARQLRGHASLSGTTLIALSGWGTEEDRARGRDAGFDYHLTKPVLLDDVQAVLGEAGARKIS